MKTRELGWAISIAPWPIRLNGRQNWCEGRKREAFCSTEEVECTLNVFLLHRLSMMLTASDFSAYVNRSLLPFTFLLSVLDQVLARPLTLDYCHGSQQGAKPRDTPTERAMRRVRRKLQRCFSAYRFVAMTIVNTVVLVLLLNAFLAVVYWCKDLMVSDPVSLKYGYSSLSVVYPDLTQSETELLLRETWTRQYAYEPFRQFRESPFRGKYVNVDSNGFRLSENQGVWPPSPECVNIFLFGGSTAFGYGVSDHQTTASCLQRHLKD